MLFKLTKLSLFVIAISSLTACGGGGSGGQSSTTPSSNNSVPNNSAPNTVDTGAVVSPNVPAEALTKASTCRITGVPDSNPISTANVIPNIQDATATATLVKNMVTQYDDFINNNPCDNWFYFPDDPRQMTAADKARFLDPNFWPVELNISDEYPAESLEAMRRAMNFMRYAVHTKAFAHILKEKIILDRGLIVDYREVLLAIRAMDYPVTIQVNKNRTVNDNAWFAPVRDAVLKGVRIPPAGNIPSNFDPTFAMPDGGATVTPSPRFTGPATTAFIKSYDSAEKLSQVLGMGATSLGPQRSWFNYGVDIVILQLLPHEVLHVVGYTHSSLDNTNTATWPKNGNGVSVINGTPITDVNYAVGLALSDLYGVYFGYKTVDYAGKYNYNFNNPNLTRFSANDARRNELDSIGLPKWYYATTENLHFPMNYYGAPYISRTSAVGDRFNRNLGDIAYDVNNVNNKTWTLYLLGQTVIKWNCNGTLPNSNCIGAPDSAVSGNVNYFGQPSYFTTSAQWTLATPKNQGNGLIN